MKRAFFLNVVFYLIPILLSHANLNGQLWKIQHDFDEAISNDNVGISSIYRDTLFFEDFEEGNFGQWNIVLGDWQISEEGSNSIAHLRSQGVIAHRKIVTISELPDSVRVHALVKGNNSDPLDPMSDITIGFFANSNASSGWWANIGYGTDGQNLSLDKWVDGSHSEGAVNPDITSQTINGIIWR